MLRHAHDTKTISLDWRIVLVILLISVGLRMLAFNPYLEDGDPQTAIFNAIKISQGAAAPLNDTRGPLSAALIAFGFKLTGSATVGASKLFPEIFSILLVLAAIYLAHSLTGSRQVAYGTGFLCACSYILIRDSHNVTYYTQYAFLSISSLYFLYEFIKTKKMFMFCLSFVLAVLGRYTYSIGNSILLLAMVTGIIRFRVKCIPFLICLAGCFYLFPLDLKGSAYTNIFLSGENHVKLFDYMIDRINFYMETMQPWFLLKPSRYNVLSMGILEWTGTLLFFGPIIIEIFRRPLILIYCLLFFIPYLFFEFKNFNYMTPLIPITLILWISWTNRIFRANQKARTGLLVFQIILYIMLNFPLIVMHIKQIRAGTDYLKKNIVFYSTGLNKVVDWIVENVPEKSSMGTGGFYEHLYVYLQEKYRIFHLTPQTYDQTKEWDQRKLELKKIFLSLDFFILDDVFASNKNAGMLHDDFLRLIRENESASELRLTLAFEQQGEQVHEGIKSLIQVYKIEKNYQPFEE